MAFDPGALRTGDRELYRLILQARELEGTRVGDAVSLAGPRRPARCFPRDPSTIRSLAGILVAPRLKVALTGAAPDSTCPAGPGPGTARSLVRSSLTWAWDEESVSIAGEEDPARERAIGGGGALLRRRESRGTSRLLRFLGRLAGGWGAPTSARLRLCRIILGSSRWSSCTAQRPARSLGQRCSTVFQADPELRSRYQAWFFQYDSGNPVALSSLHLREALTETVAHSIPKARTKLLRRMVLIGHSQGGLLVKMQAISTRGSALERRESQAAPGAGAVGRDPRPVPEGDVPRAAAGGLSRGVHCHPASRQVSWRGGNSSATSFRRVLTPSPLSKEVGADVFKKPELCRGSSRLGPTAIDNMSPKNPFIQGLQQIPVAPSIKAHSIIAVEGDGPIEEGNDGVVGVLERPY